MPVINSALEFLILDPGAVATQYRWLNASGGGGVGGGVVSVNDPVAGLTRIATLFSENTVSGPFTVQALDAGNAPVDRPVIFDVYPNQPLSQADVRTAVGLSGANLDGQLAAIAAAIAAVPASSWALTNGVESGITPAQALRAIAAVLAGKAVLVAGGIQFKNLGGSTTRVQVTAPGDGSRPAVTLTL